jgi:hypothetical protein
MELVHVSLRQRLGAVKKQEACKRSKVNCKIDMAPWENNEAQAAHKEWEQTVD